MPRSKKIDPTAPESLAFLAFPQKLSITHKNGNSNCRWGERMLDVSHRPPRAEDLPVLMQGFVEWLEGIKGGNDKLHAAIAAGLAHFEFVRIHPFKDGNGRTSRLLTTLLLLQRGYDFKRMFCITEFYNRKRDKYYDALQCVETVEECDSRLVLDASHWLKYFLGGLAYQMVVAKKKIQILIDNMNKKNEL